LKTWVAIAVALAVAALALSIYTFSATRPEPEPDAGAQKPSPPRVGCTACHVKVSDQKNYTLGAEALAIENHPTQTPEGEPINEQSTFSDCMTCHATAASGRAVAAKTPMVLTAHPAHMFSEIFTEELGGTCWSCHLIDSRGNWLVVPDKVDVEETGIPKELPVPNLWVPRAGTAGGGA